MYGLWQIGSGPGCQLERQSYELDVNNKNEGVKTFEELMAEVAPSDHVAVYDIRGIEESPSKSFQRTRRLNVKVTSTLSQRTLLAVLACYSYALDGNYIYKPL